MLETIVEIVGFASDEAIGDQLHRLQHQSAVDTIILSREDTLRRRLCVVMSSRRLFRVRYYILIYG